MPLWKRLLAEYPNVNKAVAVKALSLCSDLSGDEQLKAASELLSITLLDFNMLPSTPVASPPSASILPSPPPPPSTTTVTPQSLNFREFPLLHCLKCIEEIDNPKCEGCGEKFGFGGTEGTCCFGDLCPVCIDEMMPKCNLCENRLCGGVDGGPGTEYEDSPSSGLCCPDCLYYADGEKCDSCEQRHLECESDDGGNHYCPDCIVDCAGEKCGACDQRSLECVEDSDYDYLCEDCLYNERGPECTSCGQRTPDHKWSMSRGDLCPECYDDDVDGLKCSGCNVRTDELGMCGSTNRFLICAECRCEEGCEDCARFKG
ncbi:hypothetical protein TrST_g4516 [Triparma strigata]|uniref:Uncharacterized protein n=1 Tax=Triparma strigata TaxID=1606541 RepID=A0A9W7DX60_9STRA|nr:hypothetical protein TrST_g4516 [Triparma strigata]